VRGPTVQPSLIRSPLTVIWLRNVWFRPPSFAGEWLRRLERLSYKQETAGSTPASPIRVVVAPSR
jgi:hypothetical protein